nr:hypothetical protein [Tanacetum cinerariifolium]
MGGVVNKLRSCDRRVAEVGLQRLNVSEEVAPLHDRAHLIVAAEEVSGVNEESCSSRKHEDLIRVGGTVLNVPKKRQRNIPSIESPSKIVDHEVENRMRHFGGINDSDLDPEIVEGESLRFLQLYIDDTDHRAFSKEYGFSLRLCKGFRFN